MSRAETVSSLAGQGRVAKTKPGLPILRRLAQMEPFLVAGAAPLLLFPRGILPWFGIGMMVLGRLLRGIAENKWIARTQLDRPVAILSLMALASLYPSTDLSLSMPKFYGILLGLFVYYAVVGNVRNKRRFWIALGLLIAGLLLISVLGLVGTGWNVGKYPQLQRIQDLIPQAAQGVQVLLGRSHDFHPNMVGMALAFLLPLPLSLVLHPSLPILQRWLLAGSFLFGLGVLVLSGSRSSFIALAVSGLMLLVWKWRRIGLVTVVVLSIGIAVVLSLGGQNTSTLLLKVDNSSAASGWGSVPSRLEVWDRARLMIEDFPFTGIGLNTFPIVLDTFYPSFISGPNARIPHAHNIYLQTALDLGLGGLLGFLGLFACTAGVGWRAYRQLGRKGPEYAAMQAAIVGLLAGLLAYLVSGLTDATQLGTRQSVLLWLMMGLIVAGQRLSQSAEVLIGKRTADPVSSGGSEDSGLQAGALLSSSRSVAEPFGPGALATGSNLHARHLPEPAATWRVVLPLLTAVWEAYWVIAYVLVGLGYLVVGLGISGWTP